MVGPRLRRWLGPAAVTLAIAALVVTGIGFGAERYFRSDPRACGSCHPMQTPLRLWAEGEHHDVACQRCHVLSRFEGLTMLWGMVRGAPPGRGHARVDAATCAACHFRAETRWPEVARSPGHRLHVGERGVSCLACHGASMHTVRPTVESCASCHPGRKVVLAGMESFHCFACHNFRTAGDTLLRQRPECLRCHARHDVSEDRFPAAAPMAFRCSACHEPHRAEAQPARPCASCHEPDRLAGLHGRHAAAPGGCAACHRPHAWSSAPERCTACHVRAAEHAGSKGCAECHGFRPAHGGPARPQ